MSNSKQFNYPVAIHFMGDLNTVELVKLNDTNGDIQVVTAAPCQIDSGTRRFPETEILVDTIKGLYNNNGISNKNPALVVLPSFFTKEADLADDYGPEELQAALTSEAERFHAFKSVDPQVGWLKVAPGTFLYSAYPKPELDKLIDAFNQAKIPIQAIELNYFSILRGLFATDTITDCVQNNSSWCFMVINDTNVFMALLKGFNLEKTIDSPIYVSDSASENEDLINDLVQDFESLTDLETFSKLVLVNNTNGLSSSLLLERLPALKQGGIQVAEINQNGRTLRSLGSPGASFPCSLEGIGGSFYNAYPEVPSINLKSVAGSGFVDTDEIKDKAFKVMLGVAIFCFVGVMLFGAVVFGMLWMKDEEIRTKAKEASKIQGPASPNEITSVREKLFIKKAQSENIKVNNALVNLGKIVKGNIWLEKIELTTDTPEDTETPANPIKLHIEGGALDSAPVGELWKELKIILQREDIKEPNFTEVQGTPPASGEEAPEKQIHWVIESNAPTDAQQPQAPGGG